MPKGWRVFAERVPPSFLELFERGVGKSLSERGLRQTSDERPIGFRGFDVREWLHKYTGIALPPGSVATYSETKSTIEISEAHQSSVA